MRLFKFKKLCFFISVVSAFTAVPNRYRGLMYLLNKWLKWGLEVDLGEKMRRRLRSSESDMLRHLDLF